jgi:N-acetylglucosamine-6-phosphate deacetylase
VSDGVAIRLPDGRLAGSCLTLDRAVRNLRAYAGASLRDAVAACTLRPARLLGIEAERGTLRRGAHADLVLLDEAGLVVETWVAGARMG